MERESSDSGTYASAASRAGRGAGSDPGRGSERRGQGRLPRSVLAAYAPPILGLSALVFYVQLYFLKFATDVLLLAPWAAGLVFGLGRLWDAVSDPLVGMWSDRTRSRLGRRRPWLFAGAALLGVTFVVLWRPPAAWPEPALIAFCAVALLTFFTALTFYLVPHQALGAELSDDYHERSRIFGLRQVFFLLGMVGAIGFLHVATNAADRRAANSLMTLILAGGATLILFVPPLFLRERPDYQRRGGAGSWRAISDVLVHNPHARQLLCVWLIDCAAVGMLSVLAPYLAEYVLERPRAGALLPGVFLLASLLAVPLWVMLARRVGKRDAWIAAMVVAAVGFGAVFFAGPDDLAYTIGFIALAGAGYGCGGAIGPSLLADTIDYDEVRTGERKEGVYSAAWGFVLKLAFGLTGLAAGGVLDLAGFQPNVAQSESALLALRSLFSVVPFVLFLAGAIYFRRFALDRAEHARLRAALD